ncbi:MAG: AAA family ATPase [Candidatus Helarchaeota archaeon]
MFNFDNKIYFPDILYLENIESISNSNKNLLDMNEINNLCYLYNSKNEKISKNEILINISSPYQKREKCILGKFYNIQGRMDENFIVKQCNFKLTETQKFLQIILKSCYENIKLSNLIHTNITNNVKKHQIIGIFKMRRFCLIGIKGVGKTTLLKSIIGKIPNIMHFTGSSILKMLVEKDGGDFSKFDNLPEIKKKRYRKEAIKYMLKLQEKNKKNIIVDGHTTLYNPNSNRIEGVFTIDDCNFYTDLILYETSPNTILKRRLKDKTKKRSTDLDFIKKELECERIEAQKLAKKYGMKLHYLNEEDYPNYEKLQSKLIEILSI